MDTGGRGLRTVSGRHGYRREGTKNGLWETWIPSLGDMDTGGRGLRMVSRRHGYRREGTKNGL